MTDFEAVAAGIETKVRQVLEENQRLRATEKELTENLQALREQVKQQTEIINKLKEENTLVKLGDMLTRKGDSTEIKLRINQLLRSIDKSLAILNPVSTQATGSCNDNN